MKIMVTNDDGIDSVGLHRLALAMRPHGEVYVVAPDTEYSGAGCAVGALNVLRPEIHKVHLPEVDHAWTVSGPPALCVMFARLGAFDAKFDLVVSGINPGANVGRAVYHSGTVGAAISARNGGITGVAVSQDVTVGSVMGQAWDEMLLGQRWDTAAEVASHVVGALVAEMPDEALCLNLNVPNIPVEELKGWKRTELASQPGRTMATVDLEPKIGHDGAFHVRMNWGDAVRLPEDTDAGAVQAGYVSVTWLSKIMPIDPGPDHPAEKALQGFFA